MRNDPVLHHFEISPFSEKVRAILGLKRMAWKSVLVPLALPKPDVTALTGGHRRTPVLQIGADVYCDTALIAEVIDTLQPDPPLVPQTAPMAPAVAAWADGSLFWQAVMNTQSPEARAALFRGITPEAVQALRDDRAAFTAGLRRPTAIDAQAQLRLALEMFERSLARSPWLLGEHPSIADFSSFHPLWFMARAEVAHTALASYPATRRWFDRIASLGHGQRQDISSAEAIGIAAAATSHAAVRVDPGLGFEAADAVTVSATDYGTEPVRGTLVGLGIDRVTLERRDERAGTVHVHFPRRGFEIRKLV